MKILEALIQLGLDIDTGIGGMFKVNDIEALTEKRIVGNGSTIRRDIMPYEAYNIETIDGEVPEWVKEAHKNLED